MARAATNKPPVARRGPPRLLPGKAGVTKAAAKNDDAEDTEPTVKISPRRLLKTSPDDHLSTYFRDLAEYELLGPEQERQLSRAIEEHETLAWERVLSRADVVPLVAAMIEGQTETPVSFARLRKAAEAARLTGKKSSSGQAALARAARATAVKVRATDLDRIHMDATLAELERLHLRAREGDPSVSARFGSSPFAIYLDGIRRAHRAGSDLRDEFVRANLRLVVTMARRYDRGGMPLADLIQEGNLGLMHAVSRFDYRRGLRFSTYACWWIRHAIGRALADKARAVRIPVHMLEAQQQLEKVRHHLSQQLGRQPSPPELAKAARLPLAKLNQMHRYLMGQPLSLDRPVHEEDDRAFGDVLADPTTEEYSPADDLTRTTLNEQVSRLMHTLSPIEADVLRKRFGLDDDDERTFREIGDEYHLSRERIRQIQNSALDKLKRALEREHHGHVEH